MVIAPARRAGDPGSIPGPGENFSFKLLIDIGADQLTLLLFLDFSLSTEGSIIKGIFLH